jgi:hypothetical protein
MVWNAFVLAAVIAAPRTVVLPLGTGEAISPRSAAALTEKLAAELRRQGGGKVISPRAFPKLLSAERRTRALACAADECAVATAASVGADRAVVGGTRWDGGVISFELRVLDATRTVLAAVVRRFERGTLDDVMAAVPGMVEELLDPASRPPGVAPAPVRPPRAAEPVAAPAIVRPPDPGAPAPGPGEVILHYRRPGGGYDDLRLLTWDTHADASALRKPRFATLNMPGKSFPGARATGTDRFGAYWRIPTKAFASGRIDFLVVRGASVPVGTGQWNGDADCMHASLFWIPEDGRELWVNVPACRVLPSEAAALAD